MLHGTGVAGLRFLHGSSMTSENYIEKTKDNLQKTKTIPGLNKQPNLYLFISFDLVNSTVFKEDHHSWPMVFHHFFEIITREIKDKIPGVKLWKYVGDEVLFYFIPPDTKSIYTTIEIVFALISSVMKSINNLHPETIDKLYLKGVLWCAPVEYPDPQNIGHIKKEDFSNISISLISDDGASMPDFLGPEIDLGFRLAKHVSKNALLVGAELIYFLKITQPPDSTDRNLFLDNLRIISFEFLKGIWQGRAYPIIWYHSNWPKIKEHFNYDDNLYSENINKALSVTKGNIQSLDSAFIQTGKQELFKKYEELIINNSKYSSAIETDYVNILPLSKLSEVHAVAIVFNDKNQALIAKRPEDKKRLPSLWEFGCSQVKPGCSIEQSLEEGYKEDFGIKIDVEPLMPISTYKIVDDIRKRTIPGIIFVAKISEAENVLSVHPKKHSEVKWVAETELNALRVEEFVSDGIANLKKGFESIKKWNN